MVAPRTFDFRSRCLSFAGTSVEGFRLLNFSISMRRFFWHFSLASSLRVSSRKRMAFNS